MASLVERRLLSLGLIESGRSGFRVTEAGRRALQPLRRHQW
jgi:hypothetical protein